MTKINARSPYFLSYAEPTVSLPTYDCDIARGNNFIMTISQRGEIIHTGFAIGGIISFTSSDSGFANGKFADVSTATTRTVVFKLAIPAGFTNSSAGFFNCSIQATQPVFSAGTTCTNNTSLNGSIANSTLTTNGGTSTALTLSSKFTAGSSAILGYRVENDRPDLIAVSDITEDGGAGQAIQFTALNDCGVAQLQIYPVDALANSCDVFQNVQITVNGCNTNFACSNLSFSGGGVAQSNGAITKPFSNGTFATTAFVSVNSNGSNPIAGTTPAVASAGNTSGSVRPFTLYFKMLIPSGYNNTGDGNQFIFCNGGTFLQQSGGSSPTLPAFAYADSNHHDYYITEKGAITIGTVDEGTIESFLPIGFNTVDEDTNRTVVFTIKSPNLSNKYSNPNTNVNSPDITITQPVYTPPCSGTNILYLTSAFRSGTGDQKVKVDCTKTFGSTNSVTSSISYANITAAVNGRICEGGGKPFSGDMLFYGVSSSSEGVVGLGVTKAVFIQIDNSGVVRDVVLQSCTNGTNAAIEL